MLGNSTFALALSVVTLALGSAVIFLSSGSNDLATAESWATAIMQEGMRQFACGSAKIDDPPGSLLLLACIGALASYLQVEFQSLFRVICVLCHIATTLMVLAEVRRTNPSSQIYPSAAIYALSPVGLLSASFHGNMDSIALLFLVWAVLLSSRGQTILAALALAGSVQIKAIGVLLAPSMLFAEQGYTRKFWFVLTAVTCYGIPWMLLGEATSGCLLDGNLGYLPPLSATWPTSYLFFRIEDLLRVFVGKSVSIGSLLAYSIAAFAALLPMLIRNLRTAEYATAVLAVFLLLTPGFGVQYLVWLLPFLFLLSSRHAVRYALCAGVFMVLTYFGLCTSVMPFAISYERPLSYVLFFPGLLVCWEIWAALRFALSARRA